MLAIFRVSRILIRTFTPPHQGLDRRGPHQGRCPLADGTFRLWRGNSGWFEGNTSFLGWFAGMTKIWFSRVFLSPVKYPYLPELAFYPSFARFLRILSKCPNLSSICSWM